MQVKRCWSVSWKFRVDYHKEEVCLQPTSRTSQAFCEYNVIIHKFTELLQKRVELAIELWKFSEHKEINLKIRYQGTKAHSNPKIKIYRHQRRRKEKALSSSQRY